MALSVEEIIALYESRGAALYGGESVTQLEHALQCAALAESEHSAPSLVAASFLHDLGHLLEEQSECHQLVAFAALRGVFGAAVLEPIRLHVDAKRYLCRADPIYWVSLSPASRRSLEFQGGPLDERQAMQFIAQPFAHDAVRLRRWDDLAKVPGKPTPGLDRYAHLLRG